LRPLNLSQKVNHRRQLFQLQPVPKSQPPPSTFPKVHFCSFVASLGGKPTPETENQV